MAIASWTQSRYLEACPSPSSGLIPTETNSMRTPEIITRYLDAANRFDATDAANCFSEDAQVLDEHRVYSGLDAVRSWIDETSRKYRPQFVLLGAKAHGNGLLLAVRVSGAFPGSPVDLDYAIALRDGKISSLKIE